MTHYSKSVNAKVPEPAASFGSNPKAVEKGPAKRKDVQWDRVQRHILKEMLRNLNELPLARQRYYIEVLCIRISEVIHDIRSMTRHESASTFEPTGPVRASAAARSLHRRMANWFK